MRAVYLGTPEFAVPPLRALAQNHEVVGVFTKPDAVSGRGKKLRPNPVAQTADELGIPVFKVDSMRTPEVAAKLAELAPQIAVVVAFGEIIPEELLSVPEFGFVNVHASALPRWRGAAPVQRAILAGDEKAGVAIMRVEAGLDTGAYCKTTLTDVAEKGAAELLAELSELGASDLMDAIDEMARGELAWTEQDEALVTYAAKIEKPEVVLSPEASAAENLRRVQASSDSAPARCVVCGRPVRIMKATAAGDGLAAGEVERTKKSLRLGCAEGSFKPLVVKPEGKREMELSAFLAGLPKDAPLAWEGVEL